MGLLAAFGSVLLVGFVVGAGLFVVAVVIAWLGHAARTPAAWLRPRPLGGSIARVVVAVPPGGVGRVAYTAGGKRCSMAARCCEAQPIARGAEVVVVDVARGVATIAPLH
jgi:hypothetical protein